MMSFEAGRNGNVGEALLTAVDAMSRVVEPQMLIECTLELLARFLKIERVAITSPAERPPVAGLCRGVITIPVLACRGRRLAQLEIHPRPDGPRYSDEEIRLAEGIAKLAGMALERAMMSSGAAAEEVFPRPLRLRIRSLSPTPLKLHR